MAKKSRDKGKTGEREIAALLREHGFKGQRGVQYQGGPDSADVTGLPGFHIEVKRVEQFNLYKAMAQAKGDAGENKVPIVFHRRNNEEWVVVISASKFLEMVF